MFGEFIEKLGWCVCLARREDRINRTRVHSYRGKIGHVQRKVFRNVFERTSRVRSCCQLLKQTD